MEQITEEKRRPDIDKIQEHIMKLEVSNADEYLTEKIIAELTKGNC